MYRKRPNQCMKTLKRSQSCIDQGLSMHDNPQKKPLMYRSWPIQCMTAIKRCHSCIGKVCQINAIESCFFSFVIIDFYIISAGIPSGADRLIKRPIHKVKCSPIICRIARLHERFPDIFSVSWLSLILPVIVRAMAAF